MTVERLGLILTAIFVVAVILLMIVWASAGTDQREIRIEVAKALLQLAVVVVIGGVVATLFKAAEKSVEDARARRELRADYLERVGTAYRAVKAARRRLCAAGLTTRYENAPATLSEAQVASYTKEMTRVNEAQLELERLKIEAQSLPELLQLGGLAEKLAAMENYLRGVVKECEEARAGLERCASIKFSDLRRLGEFTRKAGEADTFALDQSKAEHRFGRDLAQPHDEVIRIISRSLG